MSTICNSNYLKKAFWGFKTPVLEISRFYLLVREGRWTATQGPCWRGSWSAGAGRHTLGRPRTSPTRGVVGQREGQAGRPPEALAGWREQGGLVSRREEEASQPPEVLVSKGVVCRSEEVVDRPPEVLVGEGGGRPAEGGCRPHA